MLHEDYFKGALSSSLDVIGYDGHHVKVLLSIKSADPFKGAPMLPSRIVSTSEEIEQVSKLLLLEVFEQEPDYSIEQLKAFSNPYRRPEGRIVNIGQYVIVERGCPEIRQPSNFSWCDINEIPQLVYDHNEILSFAKERLKRRIKRRPVAFQMLDKTFTIKQLYTLYQEAFGKSLDKRNFNKKAVRNKFLLNTSETIKLGNSKKPSSLYSFDFNEFDKRKLKGYDFKF
jgi:8-oxo-dGTP diphosphatase